MFSFHGQERTDVEEQKKLWEIEREEKLGV
jgi:hypothetical protein